MKSFWIFLLSLRSVSDSCLDSLRLYCVPSSLGRFGVPTVKHPSYPLRWTGVSYRCVLNPIRRDPFLGTLYVNLVTFLDFLWTAVVSSLRYWKRIDFQYVNDEKTEEKGSLFLWRCNYEQFNMNDDQLLD